MNDNLKEILNNPEWRLCNIEPKSGSFEFINLSREKFDERNFTDQYYIDNPNQGGLLSVPFKDIMDADLNINNDRTHFIFHSAFCGSTLLARCLNIPNKSLSIREPHALFQLSAMKRANLEYALTSPEWSLMVTNILSFLSRGYSDNEVAIIKPSNAMNNLIPDLFNAAPNSNAIFLYSGLKQFLISNLKKGEGFVNFCNSSLAMLTTTNVPLHIQDELQKVNYKTLSPLKRASMLWLFQLSQFNFFVNNMPEGRVSSLTISDLIENPSNTLSDSNDLFSLNYESKDIDTIINDGPMTKHSKSQEDTAYNKSIKDKEDKAILEKFGDEVDKTMQWATDLFGATVVETPLYIKK